MRLHPHRPPGAAQLAAAQLPRIDDCIGGALAAANQGARPPATRGTSTAPRVHYLGEGTTTTMDAKAYAHNINCALHKPEVDSHARKSTLQMDAASHMPGWPVLQLQECSLACEPAVSQLSRLHREATADLWVEARLKLPWTRPLGPSRPVSPRRRSVGRGP